MFKLNFNYYSNLALQISSGIIILVGIYIIVTSFFSRKLKHKKIEINRSKYAIAFGVGIVPCPGVMSIVLFCIMLKKYLLGIFAAVSMSLGMGLTISVVGILAIIINQKSKNMLKNKSFILELLGGVLILGLGIILFYVNKG